MLNKLIPSIEVTPNKIQSNKTMLLNLRETIILSKLYKIIKSHRITLPNKNISQCFLIKSLTFLIKQLNKLLKKLSIMSLLHKVLNK